MVFANQNKKKITEFAISDTLFLVDLFNGDESSLEQSYTNSFSSKAVDYKNVTIEHLIYGQIYNEKKNPTQSYKPSIVRGVGTTREGYCSHCDKWFRLKTSSYWYHMNYKHGISSRGLKCPEPKLRENEGRTEGLCKECQKWIKLGNNSKSVRFGWFRHWQKTHSKAKTI